MESTLLVSCTEKSIAFFSEALNSASIKKITILNSISAARRTINEQDFDLVIIDAPLKDEPGESFACYLASKDMSQVILALNNEHFNAAASVCETDGVLLIAKPVQKENFWTVLSLARSMNSKIKRIQAENAKLKQKIEDSRIINRAKCLLISYVKLSEQEAHRFIEKQAMDLRCGKRAISEEIIKTYGN